MSQPNHTAAQVKADREKEVFEYDAVMAQGAELQEFLKITMEEMC